MSLNSDPQLDYPDDSLTAVRQSFTDAYNANPNIYDELDYKRLMTDDYWLRRYMRRRKGDVAASVQFIKTAMEWRNKNQVSKMTDASFPYEFHELGGVYPYKEDVEGNSVVHVRIQLFQKLQPILELLKKFTTFQMIKADETSAAKGKGWVLLLDCSDTGVANADLEMTNFLISSIRNYYPFGQKYILIHNLPWILSAIRNVAVAMLPAHVKRTIKSSNSDTITDFIPVKNLPSYMGGDATQKYRKIPEGLSTTEEMVKLGVLKMSEEDLEKVQKYYQKVREILREGSN